VGQLSGASNTTGLDNAFFGRQAAYANTEGSYNTAIGTYALLANTTAANNTAVGWSALTANTTGASNVALGHESLASNTTASFNTALGKSALENNTTGANNTAVGYTALLANTEGSSNVAVGKDAGDAITTGVSNTVLGADAAGQLTTGQFNVCVGREAGIQLASGSYNTYMGYLAGTNDSGTTGAIVIGAGNNFYPDKGNSTGFITPNNGGVYQGNNSSTWSTTSDRRIKKNIEDNNVGLDAIKQIQVRNFEYRTEDEIVDFEHPSSAVVKKEGIQLGVIAQEIEEILPDLVKTESTGVKSVNPNNLTWYLVNAVKELSAKVEELESQIGV
jgi:trimeric autotransporter adhesin